MNTRNTTRTGSAALKRWSIAVIAAATLSCRIEVNKTWDPCKSQADCGSEYSCVEQGDPRVFPLICLKNCTSDSDCVGLNDACRTYTCQFYEYVTPAGLYCLWETSNQCGNPGIP